MANTMKAAVFEAVKVVKVKEVPIPEIGDNDVLDQGKKYRYLRYRLEHLQWLVFRR